MASANLFLPMLSGSARNGSAISGKHVQTVSLFSAVLHSVVFENGFKSRFDFGFKTFPICT